MRKLKISAIAVMAAATMAFTTDKVMRKQNDGTVVINTTTLAPDVKGYNGPTPLEIHVKDNKIVKIIALTNSETRKYLNLVTKTLLPKWTGMKADKAMTAAPDGVTGATMTSEAIKENVRRGMKYYKKNRRK